MIILKYTQGYKRAKFKFTAGFYTVVACCLLIVGGASWFTLSKISNTEKTEQNNGSKTEYRDNTSSYIESVPEIPEITAPTEEVKQNVSEEPYTKEEVKTETSYTFMMPVEGKVIKDYSTERLQYSATYGDMRIHLGVDIECDEGTQVSACGDGTVVSVNKDNSLGTVVEIDHNNGITVKYASIKDAAVKEGDTVKMGDIIGKSTTVPNECSDKNHLHIEVFKDGKSAAPLKTLGLS